MLAFNLGVFFRNLHGQPVAFDARREGASVHFVGGVESLQEKTALVSHLSVVLACDDLRLEMAFDEGEEEEGGNDPEVFVTVIRLGMAEPLFEATFAFDQIRLQPVEPETGLEEGTEPAGNAAPDPRRPS